MNKFKNIILDFDGTIYDTSSGIVLTLKQTLDDFNITYDLSSLTNKIGLKLEDMFLSFADFKKEQLEKMVKYYRSLYQVNYLDNSTLYPGVKELFKLLADNNIKILILSFKPEQFIKELLIKDDLYKYITFIYPLSHNSDKKEIIKLPLVKDKYQIDVSSDTIMVGDHYKDIEAGKAIGATTVYCRYGYCQEEIVRKYQPDFTIDQISQLINIMKG